MAASSFIQSNTIKGRVVKLPAADLTGLEGTLVSIQSTSGLGTVNTTGAGSRADFILLEGGGASSAGTPPSLTGATNDLQTVSCLPLTSDQQVRVIANGAFNSGIELQSDSSGKAVAASTGNWVFGISEGASTGAGVYALIRPVGPYKK